MYELKVRKIKIAFFVFGTIRVVFHQSFVVGARVLYVLSLLDNMMVSQVELRTDKTML